MQNPETKVKAATGAAAVTGFMLWALATYAFHGDVPAPVEGLVAFAVPGLVTLVAGYLSRHTPRTPPAE